MLTFELLVASGVFLSHSWMMFFYKNKLGSESTDRSEDPVYKKWKANLGFAYVSIVILIGYWFYFRGRFYNSGDASIFRFLCFSAVYWIAFFFRLWSMKILGRLFTYEIGIRSGHDVIQEGPYKILRHPSYTGYIVMVLGVMLSVGSWVLTLAGLFGVLFFLILRINHEEKMLTRHFGKKYMEYRKRTWRLLPYVY